MQTNSNKKHKPKRKIKGNGRIEKKMAEKGMTVDAQQKREKSVPRRKSHLRA
jgi:hypothetical protein